MIAFGFGSNQTIEDVATFIVLMLTSSFVLQTGTNEAEIGDKRLEQDPYSTWGSLRVKRV